MSWSYTPNGNVATVTDSSGVTSYAYDDNNRLLRVSEPDGSEMAYTYDAEGNRTSVTVPSGTTTYTYDAIDRLTTVTDPSGGTCSK